MLTSISALVAFHLLAATPAPGGAVAPGTPAQPQQAGTSKAMDKADRLTKEGQGETSPYLIDETGVWRGARWGMTVEQVMRHFTGEARRVEPELQLANGTTVSVRLDGQQLLGHPLRAGFVFQEGKLILVSLRTPENHFTPAPDYQEAVKLLKARLGPPLDDSKDDNFIDMRHASWARPMGIIDLKYIPGVMVLQYHPAELKADASK